MKQMTIFTQFHCQKPQKKGAKKRTRSDNDVKRDSDSSYLQSNFKHSILGQKRQKGIPTTDIVEEVTINGIKIISESILAVVELLFFLKKLINKSIIVKYKKPTTEWTALGGTFDTKKKVSIQYL
jgi:hypothetical protein